MTPTIAARTDLAPRVRRLLATQLADCGELLEVPVRGALDDLEHELFRIAEQSSGGQAQHEALEGLRETRRTRPGFHAYIVAQLEQRFATAGDSLDDAGASTTPRGPADLALVDPHEFDETMALGDLSTRIELHVSNALFELCHRYAVLLEMPPLETDALPPGPHVLADVLGKAAPTLGLSREHRLLFYRLCDRRLSAAADTLYTHLNNALREGGILPHLRSYLPRRAATESGAGPVPAPGPDTHVAEGPIAPATDFSPYGANPMPAPPDAAPPDMATLHTLLDARRRALAPDAAAAQASEFASMPQLQEALAALQAMPSRRTDANAGKHLANDLMVELKRHRSDHLAPRLQPEHRDALDLIGLLYDQLLAETREQGAAQQMLAGLQVPLLRVALADNRFFTVREHPARRLLNTVLETANLWLDRSDGAFDTALNQRLQRSVQQVATGFDGNLDVIERAADDLDAHLRLLSRRAEIAERRQVEAAQGRDRLRAARATARAAIDKRLGRRRVTPLVRALLEHAWSDALTLTLLRQGENSEAWRRRLAVIEQVLEPSPTRDDERLAADLNHGLTQVGLQASEADQITRYALELPPAAPAPGTPQPPSQTELLIRLKSRQKTQRDTTEAPAGPRKLALTPTERKALETLKALPFGSWLEFTVNQQGQKIARKLAWYSPGTGRCLLVNVRGAAAPERTLEQIARLMARGQVHPMADNDGGIIDRAWQKLLSGLRKFGRGATATERAK
ncbi:MAG TPA: DUF1631 family protein [Rhodanobacteraceae bacterium]|nr:DUF1631 family protein [Rhodanobacteraceae bacterium]